MKQTYALKLGEGEAARVYSLVRTPKGLLPRLGDREVSCRATLELIAAEMERMGIKDSLAVGSSKTADTFRVDGLYTGGYF